MNTEQLKIASKEFEIQTKEILDDLYKNKSFSDVTLVTEDEQVIKAHRCILEPSSPVFKKIFIQSPAENQTVYLRGIKSEILEQIIKFCYQGYVEIDHEKIWDFFAVAVDLKVKKLCEMTDEVIKKNNDELKEKIKSVEAEATVEEQVDPPSSTDDVQLPEDTEMTPATLDDGDKKMVEATTAFLANIQKQTTPTTRKWQRKVKSEPRIKSEPGTATDPLKCEECGQIFTFIGNLRRHNLSVHQGVKYGCDQCDYKATQSTDIKRHKQFKHEGVRFDCSMCEYKATTKGSLKLHFEAKHQGIKYPCDSCDYKATTTSALNLHMQNRHSNIQHQCEFCDFQAKTKFILKSHKTKNHSYGVMNIGASE